MEIARGNVICLVEDSEKCRMQMRNLLCCAEVDFPWVYHYSSLMSWSSVRWAQTSQTFCRKRIFFFLCRVNSKAWISVTTAVKGKAEAYTASVCYTAPSVSSTWALWPQVTPTQQCDFWNLQSCWWCLKTEDSCNLPVISPVDLFMELARTSARVTSFFR